MQLFILLLLMVGAGYGFLLLFSLLSGVSMTAAMCWGFRAKHLELTLPWCIVYVLAFVMVMVVLGKPYALWNLSRSHTGVLLGYTMSDEEAKFFDPVRKQYETFKIYSPPSTPETFNDAFRLVVLYRPSPSADYYNNAISGTLWVSLFMSFIACLFVVGLYMLTYAVADLYIKKTGLSLVLSHRLLLDNGSRMLGFPLSVVLAALGLFILAVSVASGSMVKRITTDYEERFSLVRDDLRQEVLSRAAPGMILKGVVVNRVRDVTTIHGSREDDQDQHLPTATYTIEFKGLAKYFPVYLGIRYVGEPETIPDRQMLDRMFPPIKSLLSETQRDREPREMRELDFLVNEDFSVSPVEEAERR